MSDTTTRTACVVRGASPEEVSSIGVTAQSSIRANALGALVTGRYGELLIDYASLPGPVFDVMYNADTGWFSVTVYRGLAPPVRWDNRPGSDPGYPRVPDILGATCPATILVALDVPASAIGYAEA